MLLGSVINQTYLFSRERHIQIQSAKVNPKDLLHQIEKPELYFMEQIQKFIDKEQKSIESCMSCDQGTKLNLKRLQKHTQIKLSEEVENFVVIKKKNRTKRK